MATSGSSTAMQRTAVAAGGQVTDAQTAIAKRGGVDVEASPGKRRQGVRFGRGPRHSQGNRHESPVRRLRKDRRFLPRDRSFVECGRGDFR